jgi:Uma2 family endonuclease
MTDVTTGPIPRLLLEGGPPRSRRLTLVRSISDEEKGYEVIGSRLVPKPRSVRDTVVANDLRMALAGQPPDRSGHLYFGVLFDWPGVENFYRPDVSFVPEAHWPPERPFPDGEAWSVVPTLAVDVFDRRTTEVAAAARAWEYLIAGVRRVWHVLSHVEQVLVWDSPTVVRVLTRADELTGDPVVPEFRLPVADLFPPAAPTP